MNEPRAMHATVLVGGRSYIFGGTGESDGSRPSGGVDEIESFTPGLPQIQWNAKSNFMPRWNHYLELVNSVVMQKDNKIGVGNTSPSSILDLSGNSIRVRDSYTPSSSSESCEEGTIAWDDNYNYTCTSTGWKRSSLTTW